MNINLELFGKENIDFLENTMCLDLIYIQKEITKTSQMYSIFFRELFTWMVKNYISYSKSYAIDNISTKNKLFASYGEIEKKYNVESEHYIAFELCHAYDSFCMGGIEDMWLHADYSSWYPKIIWKEPIASDVEMLDKTMIIYRGTSQDEFNSKIFGQSWTLVKGIARKFAFREYAHSSQYKGQARVVLKATVNRDDVLYYKRITTAMEDEVIVIADNLLDISVLESKNTI